MLSAFRIFGQNQSVIDFSFRFKKNSQTPAPHALRRTMPKLADLPLGEALLIDHPVAKNPLIKIHMKAKRFGVKFALKSIHSKIKIKRIG